ncbi:hypothetical protein GYB22_12730 [bacterium]|nr:hypothetical protein [bacterium]
MGGEGSMSGAIQTIRYNKGLRDRIKSRNWRTKNMGRYGDLKKKVAQFKELSVEDKERIRKMVRRDYIRAYVKISVFTLVIVIALILIISLF